jgi:hypothetical protein
MPLSISLAIRCDKPGCNHTIQHHSKSAGVNATLIRRIATDEFGWQATSKGVRCYDHRTRVVGFHEYEERKNGFGGFCGVCENLKGHPKHNKAKIEVNAACLRNDQFVEYHYGD